MDMLFCVFVLLSIDITCAQREPILLPNVKNDETTTTKNTSQTTPDSALPTTQTTPDSALPTNTIIYIGVGVLLAVVIIVQAICCYVYIRNVRATRHAIETIIRSNGTSRSDNSAVRATRHTIETIIRSNGTSRSDNSAVRYSKAPATNTKRTYNAESNIYEIIPEIGPGKTPPPPPVETLPRKKLPPPPTIGPPKPITERIRLNSTSSSISAQSLRREKTIRAPIREPKPVVNRPKLPLPNEIPEKPSTLPKRHNDNSPRINHKIPSSMSIPRNDVDKNELMAKLKQRQALTEGKTNVQRSVSNASLPTKPASLSRRPKRMPPAPVLPPKPHVKNDSDDSDDEWEMEQLKPINLYNI